MTRLRICKIQVNREKSLKAVSPAVAYILLTPFMELAHIYTCRCELISFLYSRVLQNLQTKECQEGSHSLCLLGIPITKNIINSINFINFKKQLWINKQLLPYWQLFSLPFVCQIVQWLKNHVQASSIQRIFLD